MINLSSAVIEQKNNLSSTESILILLEIDIPSLNEPITIVRNNENIVWNSKEWISFPFELEEISENTFGEIPKLVIKLANASRVIEKYLIDYDNWLKTHYHQTLNIKIHIVSTADLLNNIPIKTYEFEVSSFDTNAESATFNLTQKNVYTMQFPTNRLTRKCRFKFGSVECGYSPNSGETCNKSLADCRKYNNSPRFGGFPSVGGRFDKTINE